MITLSNLKLKVKMPAKDKASTIKLIDALVVELSILCNRVKELDNSELVGLNRALRRAQRLRKRINSECKESLCWKALLDSIVYLIIITKKFYSLLINCIRKQFFKNEFWDNNKIIAYC